MQGMTNIGIDYAKNSVTVNYDPEKASPQKIRESLQKAGFEPNVAIDEISGRSIAETVHDHHATMVQKGKANELRMKVIASGVIFILVFLGSFPQWFPWMPDFLKNNFVLLALATPVQFWAGSQFYKGAWVALKVNKLFDISQLLMKRWNRVQCIGMYFMPLMKSVRI